MMETFYRLRQLVLLASGVALANSVLLVAFVPSTPLALAAAFIVAFFICAAPVIAGAHIIAIELASEGISE